MKIEAVLLLREFLRAAAGPNDDAKSPALLDRNCGGIQSGVAQGFGSAHNASGRIRETCLRSFFSTHASSSNPETSPAIWTSIGEASKREIFFTPLRPSSAAVVNSSTPIPFGLTTPIPVMTVRRDDDMQNTIAVLITQW